MHDNAADPDNRNRSVGPQQWGQRADHDFGGVHPSSPCDDQAQVGKR